MVALQIYQGSFNSYDTSARYNVLMRSYLVVLWLWTNWLFWRAGCGVASHGITVGSMAQWQANSAVFGLLDEMRSVSQAWAVNHAVRAVTSGMMAEAGLVSVLEHVGSSNTLQVDRNLVHGMWYFVAIGGFLVVFATAAAPGYVTTNFYERTLSNLVAVAPIYAAAGDGDTDADDGGDGVGVPPPKKDTPSALMQRMAAARGADMAGMHFAGVPMTVQKATTVSHKTAGAAQRTLGLVAGKQALGNKRWE
jgi:hypothetical protein